MKINIRTAVQQDYRRVWQGFDSALFLRLAPPFPRMHLLRFDGCRRGDEVHVVLDFLLFTVRWHSLIVEDGTSADEFYFVDRGTKLPFFLRSWQHRHCIVKKDSNTEIVDRVEFHTPYRWLDVLMYPVIYLQFLYRQPIYRKVFVMKT